MFFVFVCIVFVFKLLNRNDIMPVNVGLNAVGDVLCYREGSAYSRRRVSSVNATYCIFLREREEEEETHNYTCLKIA